MVENDAVFPVDPLPTRSKPAARRLQRESLADQVAETVRGMILTGEIAPESPITQGEIARLLGVSTMPAREALLRLGAEGFLISSPNRSFIVRRITEQDIRDIYWMHAKLAGELTRRACTRKDESVIQSLRECEATFTDALRRGDPEGMDTANWRFHRTINKAAEAPKLWMLLNATLRFVPNRFYALLPAWADESEKSHAELLQAFERHDGDAARMAAETHVRAAGELLISSFWRSHAWVTPEHPA